ncbi:MAG: hypothetical protein QNL01_06735 [Akkermansiaceae bacterium]
MNDNTPDNLAKGTITLDPQTNPIVIPYQEHPDRNGQLLAQVNAHPLTSSQLLDLNQELQNAEDQLRKGRARYASIAMQDAIMLEAFGHLLNQPEDNS